MVSSDSLFECVDSCNKIVAAGINWTHPRFTRDLILSTKKRYYVVYDF